jgi:hypothetical protein
MMTCRDYLQQQCSLCSVCIHVFYSCAWHGVVRGYALHTAANVLCWPWIAGGMQESGLAWLVVGM